MNGVEIYSVDASHNSLLPLAVVNLMDKYEKKFVNIGSHNNLPITARGAGTGLLGQSLSDGVVIDFTKHMNQIIEIEDDYVVAEPGPVKGVLDRELRRRGKFLPPDPASSNYCTIGGMMANNSRRPALTRLRQIPIYFLEALSVVFADGSFGFLSEQNSCEERTTHLLKLLSPYLNGIQSRYLQVKKNSCGYKLDAVLNDRGFIRTNCLRDQGTLGLVTSWLKIKHSKNRLTTTQHIICAFSVLTQLVTII